MWSKLKIVTIQWMKSKIWGAIDDWYINNLAKNHVSAVFHLRVICRNVSPEFIELSMETPCLCHSEGHKHGGRKVTEHLSLSFAIETKSYCSRALTNERNVSSGASNVLLAKTKVIIHLLTYANCWGNLTNCDEVTCDGLASHQGEVENTSSRFMLQKTG